MLTIRRALSALLMGAGVAAWGWAQWQSMFVVVGVVSVGQAFWAVMCWCDGTPADRFTWGPLTMAMWLVVHPFTKHARLRQEQADEEAPHGF